MTKKLGTFIPTKSYNFTVEEPVPQSNTIFSPSIPPKSKINPPKLIPKRVQSAKVISKPKNDSKSSFNSLDLNIPPNYPEPVTRSPQRPVTVKQILCEYEQEITNYNMMPLKVDLKPHILQTIKQQSLSKTGKAIDLYNKTKSRTITELRTREKYQSKADSAVKVWLDQLEQEQNKQSTKFTQSFEAFQKAQARLDRELQVLMAKVHMTKAKNEEAFSNLTKKAQDMMAGTNEEPNFNGFTCSGKPVKVKSGNEIMTQAKIYGQVKDYSKLQVQVKENSKNSNSTRQDCLISDDESFMDNIDSPEDFEVLSEDELD